MMAVVKQFAAALVLVCSVAVGQSGQNLMQAVEKGETAPVKKLLDADPKLALQRDANGNTPLHTACRGNNLEIVQLLLAAGADVNASGDDDRTPLHDAAGNKNPRFAELLVAHGADVRAASKFDKFTPLHRAALTGATKTAALLLAKGADVEGGWDGKKLNPSIPPLMFAAREGHVDVARLLLAKGAKVNAAQFGFRTTPLSEATERQHKEMVRLLLARGADPNADSEFGTALRSGTRQLIDLFLAKGADCRKPYLLVSAVMSGKKEIVELLLSKGAAANASERGGPSGLQLAANFGHADIVELLLAKGANPKEADDRGVTPLHMAASTKIAAMLLAKGADIDAVTKKGQSPMFLAVQRGNRELAEFLESKGAEHDRYTLAALGRADLLQNELRLQPTKDLEDSNHLSPLHLAARFGQTKAAAVLLDKGADVNALSHSGETPLHQAAAHGHTAMIQLLLEYKADINAKSKGSAFDPKSYTPLETALHHGKPEVVKLLRKAGALPKIDDPKEAARWLAVAVANQHLNLARMLIDEGVPLESSATYEGKTLLHVAASQGDLDLVKYLLAKGAKLDAEARQGRSVLHDAVWSNQRAVVAFLLEQGARLTDESHDSIMHTAAQFADPAIIEMLLAKGAKLDELSGVWPTTPLGVAARMGRLDVVKVLRARGADVKKDRGVLHAAAFHGHRDVVAFLLDQGLDVETFLPDGFPLYYFVLAPRQISALAYFAEKDPSRFQGLNANLTIEEINGSERFAIVGGRPLQAAVAGQHPEVVDLLLKRGAAVNARFPDGSVPLHLAITLGDLATVKVLLAHGADVDAQNRAGQSASQLAFELGEEEILEALRKASGGR